MLTLKDDRVYELKIVLGQSICWRKVHVEPNMPLKQLHWLIQICMGWDNEHLHRFETNLDEFGIGKKVKDNKLIKLYLKEPKDMLYYLYDFGDNWDHYIYLEKILPKDDSVVYPICVTGRKPAPVEDFNPDRDMDEEGPPFNKNTINETIREYMKPALQCQDIVDDMDFDEDAEY